MYVGSSTTGVKKDYARKSKSVFFGVTNFLVQDRKSKYLEKVI